MREVSRSSICPSEQQKTQPMATTTTTTTSTTTSHLHSVMARRGNSVDTRTRGGRRRCDLCVRLQLREEELKMADRETRRRSYMERQEVLLITLQVLRQVEAAEEENKSVLWLGEYVEHVW